MKKTILVIIIFVGKISSFEQTVTDKNAEGSWNMQDVSPFCTFWTGVGGGGEWNNRSSVRHKLLT